MLYLFCLLFLAQLGFSEIEKPALPIFPPPRHIELTSPVSINLPIKIEAIPALKVPAQLLQREIERLLGKNALSDRGKTILSLQLDPNNLNKEEEYAIETTTNKIVLRAHDTQGAFWAVHSLIQLISCDETSFTPQGLRIQGLKLRDYPQSNFRAFMVQGAWTGDIQSLMSVIELLARFKVRYVAVEFGPQVVLDYDPSIARGARFSKSQAREVIEYARSLGLEPIGYLNMLGHLERAYQKPPYTDHGGIMIQNEDVYDKFVFPILSEMIEIYGPIKWFHCGMDEAWELFSYLSQKGYDSSQLLARHIAKINEFLKEKGIKLVIWHDMFFSPELEKEIGAPIGPANGGPPQNTAMALELIPKDVILDYWFYDPLEAYPALDWLKNKGFEVWASPWQTPFSLVRYAQTRNVPTLGTIWADPPFCFTSRSLAATIALYAWASWNPQSAPMGFNPEKDVISKALKMTLQSLWGRKRLGLSSHKAMLVRVGEGKTYTLSLPNDYAKAPEQHFGVPFDFSSPFYVVPLKGISKTCHDLEKARFVLLPNGVKLKLDGVNRERGEDELILYTAPRITTGTNIYGVEVAVTSLGEVTAISDYGSGNMAIPPDGFVLSAHFGPRSEKANALKTLKPGDYIALLDEEGNLLGGFVSGMVRVELPNKRSFWVDGIDRQRNEGELILYNPGFNKGKTGTNQWGVEVVVEKGKVVEVRKWQGDSNIPDDGYVLSAHWKEGSEKAEALAKLNPGDEVELFLTTEVGEIPLEKALEKGKWEMEVKDKINKLFFVTAVDRSTSLGTPLGNFKVIYENQKEVNIPIRYGIEALPLGGEELPLPSPDNSWLIYREGEILRFLVREWENPNPDVTIRRLEFTPTLNGLLTGIRISGITGEMR
ncbi:family 20 glycosylhydrolase [bacterium]|nr:family 20 glycosylhydrolase [bacterium]